MACLSLLHMRRLTIVTYAHNRDSELMTRLVKTVRDHPAPPTFKPSLHLEVWRYGTGHQCSEAHGIHAVEHLLADEQKQEDQLAAKTGHGTTSAPSTSCHRLCDPWTTWPY